MTDSEILNWTLAAIALLAATIASLAKLIDTRSGKSIEGLKDRLQAALYENEQKDELLRRMTESWTVQLAEIVKMIKELKK